MASADSMIKALSQRSQMKRSMDLRAADSDEDVKAIVKKMVEAAIVAQAANKPKLMLRSIEELNQTVKDLINQVISVSEKTKKNLVRKLTNLSDDLKKAVEAGSRGASGGGGLANILPSFDNITSAIMTANPVLGYSARLLQTVGEGASNRKSRKLQRSQSARDGEVTADDILNDEDETSSGGGGSGVISESEKYLESILDQLVTLNSIWGDGTTETNNKLSDLVRVEEEVKEEQRLLREQNEFDSIEEQRRRDAVDENGSGPSPTGNPQDDSLLNSILGGGVGGAIMAAVTGIASFFGPILAASTSIAGLAAKVAIIPAVIYAIYEFIEGFFNAGEILGIGEDEVTISDRIAAGVGSVVDGFLRMINSIVSTVLGFFGIDTNFMPENSKQIISNSIKEIFDFYKGVFNDILSLFGFGPDQEQSLLDGVKGIAKSVLSIPLALFNVVTGLFGVDELTIEDIEKKVKEGIDNLISTVSNFFKDIFDSSINFVKENIPTFSDFKSFLGFEDDKEKGFIGSQEIAKRSMDQISGVKDTSDKYLQAEFDRRFGFGDSGSAKTSETFSMTNKGMNSTKQNQQKQSSAAIVNAPSNTNVNNTIVEGGGGNTANPDSNFRNKSYADYSRAYNH
jgi:hypothetical protein